MHSNAVQLFDYALLTKLKKLYDKDEWSYNVTPNITINLCPNINITFKQFIYKPNNFYK